MSNLEFAEYEKRKSETKNFIDELLNIEENNQTLRNLISHISSEDFIKVLRSTSFLMIYNFIEFSIYTFFQTLYDTINEKNYAFIQLNDKIKELWTSQLFNESFKPTSSFKSHSVKMFEIVLSSIDNAAFQHMSFKNSGGNLDARAIHRICERLDITLNINNKIRDTADTAPLSRIKNERNALSHGNKSFIDENPLISSHELKEYLDDIIIFFDHIASQIKNYIEEEKYLEQNNI